MEFVPQDYFIDPLIKEKRDALCMLWQDFHIFDCSLEGAGLVLLYKEVERARYRDYSPLGKSLFFWDRYDANCLYLMTTEEKHKVPQAYSIKIEEAGILSFENKKFDTPQKLIDAKSLEKNFIYQRVSILENSPLWCLLHRQFPASLPLSYPPDYPPLLGDIAVANGNYATALQVLNHPTMLEKAANGKSRYLHFLSALASISASKGHYRFFKYLAKKTSLMDIANEESLSLLSSTICSSKEQIAEYMLKIYPKEMLSKALAKSIVDAIKMKKWSALKWASSYYEGPLELPDKERALILTNLWLEFGLYTFKALVQKWCLTVEWQELIALMLKSHVSARLYLSAYKAFHQNVTCLNKELQAAILYDFIAYHSHSDSLLLFLKEYPAFKALLPQMILSFIDQKDFLKMLLSFDLSLTKEHFEALFNSNLPKPEQLEIFKAFVNQINDYDSAEKSLAMAANFGKEAVELVFEKFPKLAKQPSFVLEMAQELSRGSVIAAAKAFTPGTVDEGFRPLIKEEPAFTPEIEKIFLMPRDNQAISVGLLYNFLVPKKNFSKLTSLLLQRPECIFKFWKGLAFIGIESFDSPQWDKLAKQTLPYLPREQSIELLTAVFRFFHYSLAYLLLKNCSFISQADAIALFEVSIRSLDVAVVKVLAKAGYLFASNEKGETMLHISAKENLSEYAKVLIDLGLDTTLCDKRGISPYDIALKNQQITLCRLLKGPTFFHHMVALLKDKSPQDVQAWFWKSFLNSSSEDVLALLKCLKDADAQDKFSTSYQVIKDLIKYAGTLIVRFQLPALQQEMRLYGRQYRSYEEQQLVWAKKCESLYQSFFKEFQNQKHPILEVLMNFSRRRAGSLKGYDVWRITEDDSKLITHLEGRYFSFFSLAQRVFRAVCTLPQKYDKKVAITEKGYQILYEDLSLTHITIKNVLSFDNLKAEIIHTAAKQLPRALPYLHALFEEIKVAKTDTEKSFKELKKKIALLFWLGCHVCLTARGSSQYMVMLHRLAYNMHGLQPAPWSQKYVQPDCVALMLPFDWFYAEFYDDLFDFKPTFIDAAS